MCRNHQIALKGNVALAMGEYDFTCATTGDESKVEYTFGYQLPGRQGAHLPPPLVGALQALSDGIGPAMGR